jgi:hypothetical protein
MKLTWKEKSGIRPQFTATGVAGEFVAWPLASLDDWAVKLKDRDWMRVDDDLEACKKVAQDREDQSCMPGRRIA